MAAFHLGITLNQLRWHRNLAVVTFRPAEIEAVEESLESLKSLFVKLYPTQDGENLRTMANEFQTKWKDRRLDDELNAEWTDIDYTRVRSANPLSPRAIRDAVSQFEKLVEDYAKELETALNGVLRDSRNLQNLVVFGRKIDQARHPTGLRAVDLFRVTEMGGTCTPIRATDPSVELRPSKQVEFPPIGSHWQPIFQSTIQLRTKWLAELRAVWQGVLQDLPAPQISNTKLGNWDDCEFENWIDRQIGRIEKRLCKLSYTSAETPFLDLIVDREKRTISDSLSSASVCLTEVPWSMFITVYEAGENGVSIGQLRVQFKGEMSNRRPTKCRLNEKLKVLGVKIESNNWRLVRR